MKITDAVATEHTVYLDLFDEIERVLPSLSTLAEVKTMAGIVGRVLARHAAAEKNLALVALDHVLSHRGTLDRFHQDHKEIDDRLSQVHGASRCLNARNLLQASIAASRLHFRLEEQELFPLLEKSLQPETLRELGRTWRDTRTGDRSAAQV